MFSQSRRAFLLSSSAALVAASGCTAPGSSTVPAHWVTVYLGDRTETQDVTVTVMNETGAVLFEKNYRLSDSNEADEDAPFRGSTNPERIVVTVDGTHFERDWPGFEHPKLPCEGPNQAGIEIWIENGENGEPTVRLDAACQHVPME